MLSLLMGGHCLRADEKADDAVKLEYQVKAGFLFNFAKFVEWPARTNGAPSTFVIGVLDDGKAFPVVSAALAGKTVHGKNIEVRSLKADDDLKQCQILFVVRSQEKRVDEVLKQLKSAAVLTVGEVDRFATRGGCVNFVFQGENIRFEVNLGAAEQAGLKISSKIAGMATIVRTEGGSK